MHLIVEEVFMQFPTWKCDFEFYVNFFPVKNLIITVIWTARIDCALLW